MAQWGKNLPAMQKTQETGVQSLCWQDPLEEGMATYSRILAWRIPGTEEPGGLQSVGSQRVSHDWSGWACAGEQQAFASRWKGQALELCCDPFPHSTQHRRRAPVLGSAGLLLFHCMPEIILSLRYIMSGTEKVVDSHGHSSASMTSLPSALLSDQIGINQRENDLKELTVLNHLQFFFFFFWLLHTACEIPYQGSWKLES